MSKFQIEIVNPKGPLAAKERVYRLRYEIYCNEMKLSLPSQNGCLVDGYDDFSYSLLLSADGKDVGTIRWTPTGNGPLEIEKQCEKWRNLIEQFSKDEYLRSFEINRFMISRNFRATNAGFSLINAMRRHTTSMGYHIGFFAGKNGPLTQYYLKFGSSVIDFELHKYVISGDVLGRYCLMKVDFGRRKSLRKATMSFNYSALNFLNTRIHPVYKFLMQQGDGYRTT